MMQLNLKKINFRNDGILSFSVNQEKWVDNIFKKLITSNKQGDL